jgi:peptidoglycan/LPS O-acetylase OafA/YrhL
MQPCLRAVRDCNEAECSPWCRWFWAAFILLGLAGVIALIVVDPPWAPVAFFITVGFFLILSFALFCLVECSRHCIREDIV